MGNFYGKYVQVIGLKAPSTILMNLGLIKLRFNYVRAEPQHAIDSGFVSAYDPYLLILILYQITSTNVRNMMYAILKNMISTNLIFGKIKHAEKSGQIWKRQTPTNDEDQSDKILGMRSISIKQNGMDIW